MAEYFISNIFNDKRKYYLILWTLLLVAPRYGNPMSDVRYPIVRPLEFISPKRLTFSKINNFLRAWSNDLFMCLLTLSMRSP